MVWPLSITSLLCLVSGLLLGLTSKYGLLRFWWVVIKLALNVLLSTLVLLVLRPGTIDMAVAGRALLRGEPADTGFVDTLMFPPIVSGTLLLVASALAVFKPWGRTPWSAPRP